MQNNEIIPPFLNIGLVWKNQLLEINRLLADALKKYGISNIESELHFHSINPNTGTLVDFETADIIELKPNTNQASETYYSVGICFSINKQDTATVTFYDEDSHSVLERIIVLGQDSLETWLEQFFYWIEDHSCLLLNMYR